MDGNKRILDAPPLHMGGYQQLLRGEPFRAKFRNSWEKPEPLTPGKEADINFTMPDLFHTFRRGHRIMVQVAEFMVPADRSQSADVYRHSLRQAGGFPEGDRAGISPEGRGQRRRGAGAAATVREKTKRGRLEEMARMAISRDEPGVPYGTIS